MSGIADEIFGALPIEAQSAFAAQWVTALAAAIERRGPVPDLELKDGVEELVKLFFVHGYMAARRAERERLRELEAGIKATLG